MTVRSLYKLLTSHGDDVYHFVISKFGKFAIYQKASLAQAGQHEERWVVLDFLFLLHQRVLYTS